MKNCLSMDANNIYCDMKDLVNTLGIVMEDLEDNGEALARRELTSSALRVIYDKLSFLVDMQGGLAGMLEEVEREVRT